MFMKVTPIIVNWILEVKLSQVDQGLNRLSIESSHGSLTSFYLIFVYGVSETKITN